MRFLRRLLKALKVFRLKAQHDERGLGHPIPCLRSDVTHRDTEKLGV